MRQKETVAVGYIMLQQFVRYRMYGTYNVISHEKFFMLLH